MTTAEAVLVIGAGMLQVPLMHAAQGLGYHVIATDANPAAPGMLVADQCYVMDTYDALGTAALLSDMCARYTIRGVVTAGADVAPTVNLCAERLGLPGLPYATACLTHDKALVRDALATADLGCYQPLWLLTAGLWSAPLRATAITRGALGGWPIVVKPLAQRASRGVSIVSRWEDFAAAVEKAMAYGEEYLLEECLVGTEHSVELLLDAGRVLWWNVVDRYFDYRSGTGIEVGHTNPSCLPALELEAMRVMALVVADALGVQCGPFKVDVMLTASGPKVLECTARLSGGWDSQWTSPATGRHPLRLLVQWACGLLVDVPDAPVGAAACAAILPKKTGRVTTLPPTPQGVDVVWVLVPGQAMTPASHNGDRAGYVLTHAAAGMAPWRGAPQEVWLHARQVACTLADMVDASLEDVDHAEISD